MPGVSGPTSSDAFCSECPLSTGAHLDKGGSVTELAASRYLEVWLRPGLQPDSCALDSYRIFGARSSAS